MDEPELEILPGVKFEVVLSSPEDYAKFRDRYVEDTAPAFARLRRARALSEHESRSRPVR
jgi:hypothetical protein